jgi:uncharacterized protein YggE
MTAAALAAALLLAQAPPPATPVPPPAPRAIRVTGEGRASAAPDVARVTIGVDAQDKALARATADATARMKKVVAAIEKAGVASKDVRTSRYAVEVQRTYEKPNPGAIVGYRVSNQVQVTVRDLSRLGAILDQVVAAGSNDVGALSLEKDDPSAERARALEAAMADARAKALVLAKAAGAALGEALQVSEGGRGPTPVFREGLVAARAAADVPVSPGELEVLATVDVTFALR